MIVLLFGHAGVQIVKKRGIQLPPMYSTKPLFSQDALFVTLPYSKSMAKDLTIIDNNTLRGIIAPASLLTKDMLTNLVDFIELSSKESAQETEKLVADADNDKNWVELEDIDPDHKTK
jgi:hypothetical protein